MMHDCEKHKCGCNSNNNCECKKDHDHCCKKILKDCVCIEWTVPSGQTQTVFQTGGFKQLFASGFISFDHGSEDFVVVRFYRGNTVVGNEIEIFRDSSVAFNFTEFDRITVKCPGFTGLSSSLSPKACEGEICIRVMHLV